MKKTKFDSLQQINIFIIQIVTFLEEYQTSWFKTMSEKNMAKISFMKRRIVEKYWKLNGRCESDRNILSQLFLLNKIL